MRKSCIAHVYRLAQVEDIHTYIVNMYVSRLLDEPVILNEPFILLPSIKAKHFPDNGLPSFPDFSWLWRSFGGHIVRSAVEVLGTFS